MNTRIVAIIGLGHIGLPTAVALAEAGHRILGVDTNPSHVQAVNAGQVPFLEPGLGEALRKVHTAGLITASERAAPTDVYIVSVPAPSQGDHHVDLPFVMVVADEVSPYVSKDALVILELTSPPDTTEAMSECIEHNRPSLAESLLLAYCPERMLPGKVMAEMSTNDRIVGGLTPEVAQATQELYVSFCRDQIRLTDVKTTELSKLAENSLRGVNIASANKLAETCDHLGTDVWELVDLVNLHLRVSILCLGLGVGGHCITVDPRFIVDVVPSPARLTHAVREVNDSRPDDVAVQAQTLIYEVRAENAGQPTKIAVLGLAFKPDVDNLCSSLVITVADKLAGLDKVELLVCEPNAATLPPILTGRSNIRKVELTEGLQDADLVVSLVTHRQFRILSCDFPTVPVLDTCETWR